MPKDYPTDNDWFEKAWKPFVEYVTSELRKAGYKIVGNCAGSFDQEIDPIIKWQRSQVDGVVYEQWVVDWDGKWLKGNVIETRMNAFNADPLEVWTGDFGLTTRCDNYEQKTVLGLAMYYIALPQSGDRRSYHHYHDSKIYWLPIWDFNIGTPVEAAQKMEGKYFWSRKFSQGLVLMNYEETKEMTYHLDKAYKDVSGKERSGNVNIPPHTALILFSE